MLRKNTRRCRKFDPSVVKEVNLEKKVERMRVNKQKILAAIEARIQAAINKKLALKDAGKKKKKKKTKSKKPKA